MRIRDYEFNLQELSGSMGDLGTFFPLAVGYFAVNGMDPSGLLVMMGLANIVTGLIYHLPMPIEPMKLLAAAAIAGRWPPSLIAASGFGSGAIWLALSLTGLVRRLAGITPLCIVRGIQAALGILLAIEGLRLISAGWVLGAVSIALIALLRRSRRAPAAIVLVALGIVLIAVDGRLAEAIRPGFDLPSLTLFRPIEVWRGMVLAGFAQVALTVTNAVIATSALISRYFPDRPVPEQRLALNMGIMNVVTPFFGGMPLCHGAGGLAGQYYFGARTGGTNLIEGAIEVSLGLFLSGSIAALFALFPQGIVGAMLLLVGVQLAATVVQIKARQLPFVALTVGLSLATNIAAGFVGALALYHALRRWGRRSRYSAWLVEEPA